ncbi:hypothetical protein GCM10022289_09400 [Pedobacter jeongneungensis]|uniref:Uncharacterized protein n=1 Tax=Pedobacter jeongneungensis TaxID=947309 RepID=A0ABP8B744_9SPHI
MNPQHIIYLFIGLALLCIAVMSIVIRQRNLKYQQDLINAPVKLPEAYGLGQKMFSVHLKCTDLKQGNSILGIVFNLLTILMLVLVTGGFDSYNALPYPKIVDALLNKKTLVPIGIGIVVFLMYNAYHRVNITWENGPVVAESPVNVTHYEIKKNGLLLNVIYLQTDQKLWILVPGTSQDNTKFKDFNRLRKEQQENEKYIQQLKENLNHYGAQERKFPFFTLYLKLSFFAFILSLVLILVILNFQ